MQPADLEITGRGHARTRAREFAVHWTHALCMHACMHATYHRSTESKSANDPSTVSPARLTGQLAHAKVVCSFLRYARTALVVRRRAKQDLGRAVVARLRVRVAVLLGAQGRLGKVANLERADLKRSLPHARTVRSWSARRCALHGRTFSSNERLTKRVHGLRSRWITPAAWMY